jgi:UrcA family protein
MTTRSFLYKNILLVGFGLASMTMTALAQTATTDWRPSTESIVVTASAPKNWQDIFAATRTTYGVFLAVSASLAVPYGDLNLSRSPDVDELDRRIQIAANLVCKQLDLKYPPALYPPVGEYDCYASALHDGLARKNEVIASKR